MSQPQARIGVIGGTGLYDIEGITDVKEVNPDTPFGKPSDAIVVGKLGGVGIAFLPRHGARAPHLPYRGAFPRQYLCPEIAGRGAHHLHQLLRQLQRGTKARAPADTRPDHRPHPQPREHLLRRGHRGAYPFADPFCPVLSDILYQSAKEAGATVHKGGTFIAMEGPAFSTRAESSASTTPGAPTSSA